MNRRDVLQLGLAGIATAFAHEAEAAEGEDIPAAVARLRRRLHRTETMDVDFVRPRHVPTLHAARAEIDTKLLRSGMRAMLVTGAVMDMGEGAAAHPDVRQLLTEVGPELDHAVGGSIRRLETLPRGERRRLSAEMRRDPSLVDDVLSRLEHLAGRGGASGERRIHLRSLLKHIGWQLTHQPLATVIGEVVAQIRGQEARFAGAPAPASEGPWADATRRIGDTFDPDDEAELAVEDDAASAARIQAGTPRARRPRVAPETRVRNLRKGAGISAGVGLGCGVTAAILLGISGGGFGALTLVALFLLTPTVLGLLTALVLVLVAAVIAANAERDGTPVAAAAEEREVATFARDGHRTGSERTIKVSSDSYWVVTPYTLTASGSYRLTARCDGDAWLSRGIPGWPAGEGAPEPSMAQGAVLVRVGEGPVQLLGDELLLRTVEGDLHLAVNVPPGWAVRRFLVTLWTATP